MPSKQEEIRHILERVSKGELTVDEALATLDWLGVVIRVDRELPALNEEYYARRNIKPPYDVYVATIPLVEE